MFLQADDDFPPGKKSKDLFEVVDHEEKVS